MTTISNHLTWDQTAHGRYETQAPDGSIWRWLISSGEVSEVTGMHRRNPCLNASTREGASTVINAWIESA